MEKIFGYVFHCIHKIAKRKIEILYIVFFTKTDYFHCSNIQWYSKCLKRNYILKVVMLFHYIKQRS